MKKRTSAISPNQKPTKSSNKLRTRRDLLIEERASLSQLGLSPRHPTMLKIDRQLEGREPPSQNGLGPGHPRSLEFNRLLNSITRLSGDHDLDHTLLSQESNKLSQRRASLEQQQKALSEIGLGSQHPKMRIVAEDLKMLARSESLLREHRKRR